MIDPFNRLGTVRLGGGVLNRFERDHLRTADGTPLVRDRLTHPGAVVVVAVEAGGIWLLRQWRPAVGEWVWELPAGLLAPGEEPLAAAARECEEEIGRAPGSLRVLGSVVTSPGILDERCHVFEATDLSEVPARPDGPEEALAERHLVPIPDLPSRLATGEIRNAITISALALAGALGGDITEGDGTDQ